MIKNKSKKPGVIYLLYLSQYPATALKKSLVMKKIIGPILIATTLLCACGKSDCKDAVPAKFKDMTGLDGCGMMVELSNGKRVEISNINELTIPPIDGVKVWISYHELENMVSICMAGEIVKIDCISER